MVEAEGWHKRDGSKWLTIPEIMFHYRAGAFLVRTHAPEIAMGLPTVEELHDVIDVEPEREGNSKSDAVAATLRSKSQAFRMEVQQQTRDDDPVHDVPGDGAADDDDGPTPEQVATAINRADTPDLLDIAEDLISGVRDTKQAVQLRALATDRRLQLGGE
jgi:hypothetical protein